MAREMKDSGIEWIGEIPQEWGLSKIKYICVFQPSCNTSKLTEDSIVCYAPMECIKTGYFIHRTARYGDIPSSLTMFQSGDIVMAKVTPCFENGNIAIMSNLESNIGFGSSELFAFRPTHIATKYLFYWLQNSGFVEAAISTMTGVGGLKRVSPSFIRNALILTPQISVQERIANFLDYKCAEIDETVAQTQEAIEQYKSLKQAVITEAVTKGVRGDRPMKDSDIEWISIIPEEWDTAKGKQLFRETNIRSTDGTEELLTVSHITGITPRSEKSVNMFMSETLVDYKICCVGDIAANTMWMWQGAIGVSKYHGVISPSYNTYRQIAGAYDPEYLDYLLRIRPLVETYVAYSTGITASRLRLYPEQFLSLHFIVPPINEQREIATYLDTKCTEIDALISAKQKLLAELEAYKKSVIYEYVTGKKEAPVCL